MLANLYYMWKTSLYYIVNNILYGNIHYVDKHTVYIMWGNTYIICGEIFHEGESLSEY